MTGQQWRVVADRDKGDNPQIEDVLPGDRYTMQAEHGPVFTDQVIRIERPVPAALDITEGPLAGERLIIFPADPDDEPDPFPHPPTREQIAGAIQDIKDGNGVRAVATLEALIQNGADRG